MKRKAATFGQDLMRGEGKRPSAVPGGGAVPSGKSVYKLHTDEGYKTAAELEGGEQAAQATGTSIFDPVLCELVYRWFCPEGGQILDPFAGGSVRGLVAAKLGFHYTGIDLSARQIEANRQQGELLCPVGLKPNWINGNSLDVVELTGGLNPDLVFSCPPYADLEVYSDDEQDLSTMPYEQFREVYAAIIAQCVGLLKPNRFACFVVGDARGKDGFYYGFPWHTIAAFEEAGARLYNEAVLVTAVGSLPVRITRQFNGGRKLGKTHQNVFVFCKGDPIAAAKACGAKND